VGQDLPVVCLFVAVLAMGWAVWMSFHAVCP
jgi:hypothetical protein